MILAAPDAALLEVALRAGVVPPEVAGRPVRGARRGRGIFVELPDEDAGLLEALRGAGFEPCHAPPPLALAPAWPALCLLGPAPRAARSGPPGPLLFLLPPGVPWGPLAAELLRLGCDRQTVAREAGAEGPSFAILAMNPPLFVTLRYAEGAGDGEAFAPATAGPGSTRVWVSLGTTHPLAEALRAPTGALLCLGRGGWRVVPDGPWTPLDATLQVQAPASRALGAARSQDGVGRLRVTLRLARLRAERASPSLWVLRGGAVPRLEALLQSLPEAGAGRLRLAVAGPADDPILVLRSVPGGAPPTLPADAEAYAARPGLPRLHLPSYRVLAPPLRLDRLRAVLCPDPARVYWLVPEGDAVEVGFHVESVPESAFAPLESLIDHIVAGAARTLDAWEGAVGLDFEDLVPPVRPDAQPAHERSSLAAPQTADAANGAAPRVQAEAQDADAPRSMVDRPSRAAAGPPLTPALTPEGTAREALAAAVRAFRLDADPLDAAHRASAWADLAERYDAVGAARDATRCWPRALWDATPVDGARWSAAWAATASAPGSLPTSADLATVRAVAAHVIAAGCARRPLPWPAPALAAFLAAHEDGLDLRTRWLARRALADGKDRLALLRARDAILERLRGGLDPASEAPDLIDTPGAGTGASMRLIAALDALAMTLENTPRQRSPLEQPEARTGQYLDLLIAWGQARLGDAERAVARRDAALADLPPGDAVHAWAAAAFAARIAPDTSAEVVHGMCRRRQRRYARWRSRGNGVGGERTGRGGARGSIGYTHAGWP